MDERTSGRLRTEGSETFGDGPEGVPLTEGRFGPKVKRKLLTNDRFLRGRLIRLGPTRPGPKKSKKIQYYQKIGFLGVRKCQTISNFKKK